MMDRNKNGLGKVLGFGGRFDTERGLPNVVSSIRKFSINPAWIAAVGYALSSKFLSELQGRSSE